MPTIVMFPEELLELRKELEHEAHADVRTRFYAENDHRDMPSQLGTLAGILNLAVQGYFDHEGILALAEAIRKKLVEKRKEDAIWTIKPGKIIVPNDGGIVS